MKNKRMDIPVAMVLLGALLSAIGGYLAAINQSNENLENAKLYKQIADKNNEIANYAKEQKRVSDGIAASAVKQEKKNQEVIDLQQDLISKQEEFDKKGAIQNEKTDSINKKTKELTELNLQLVDAQKELKIFTSESLNYLTGGDSWCYVMFSNSGNGNELKVRLYHKGKYPLIALRVSIQHTSAMLKASQGSGAMQKGFIMAGTYATEIPVGTVPKSHSVRNPGIPIATVPYSPNENESYHVSFSAQNGEWYQVQSFTFDANKNLKSSTKVIRDGKELLSY